MNGANGQMAHSMLVAAWSLLGLMFATSAAAVVVFVLRSRRGLRDAPVIFDLSDEVDDA